MYIQGYFAETDEDTAGVIEGLDAVGNSDLADAMRKRK